MSAGQDDELGQLARARRRRRRPPRTGRRARAPGGAAAAGDDPPPEVAHRQQPDGEDDHDDDADREDELDLPAAARPEAQEAGRRPEHDDREEVEDPLDEDGPERPAQRDRAVDLEQVRPVDVAELGRHEAVDEPGDEDDLGGVADPERDSRCPQEQIAQRRPRSGKPEVVDDERREQQQRVRREDLAGQLVELEPRQGPTTNRTSRKSGRTIEMIVRGWRSRRPSDSWSASTSSLGRRSTGGPAIDAAATAPRCSRRRGGDRRRSAVAPAALRSSGPLGPRLPSPRPGRRARPSVGGRDPAVAAGPLDELGDRRARAGRDTTRGR